MAPEDAVYVEDRFPEEVLQLLRVGFKGGKILLSRAALVGDDNDPALLERVNGRKMFTETLVVKNKVRGRIDRGV